ncbi:sigma-70 family RNA polymerase sigma factor [Arthrobacter sp. TS-15]|uniref:sigma-70 family RNA polymerase sigma factor n=1 Tax=Arthrobacter sp. TS-15 TaxID=2510797 RepID=UPI00115E1671|nr:sigma-70 family RNA polymerase sigma factor [Arthrobacter sp. TS-15]
MCAANLIYPQLAADPKPCSCGGTLCGQRRGSGATVPNPGLQAVEGLERAEPLGWCDVSLVSAVRAGQFSAFAELFGRYKKLAAYVARVETDNLSDVDDVVGEAIASVFQALASGRGPADSFRAYLVTTVRRTAHRRNVQARRAGFLSDLLNGDGDTGYEDPYLRSLETSSLIEAFRSLPMRWQAVLWYSEVETMKPAAVAPIMGLTPNGVSALLIRARKGLRQAYFQDHVLVKATDSCADVSQHFGKFVLNDGRMPGSARIRRHVDECPKCEAGLATLHQMRSAIKGSGKSTG